MTNSDHCDCPTPIRTGLNQSQCDGCGREVASPALTGGETLLIDRVAALYNRVVRDGGPNCGAAIEIRSLLSAAVGRRSR